MRQFNADTKTTGDLEDYDSDKLDEVIRQSQAQDSQKAEKDDGATVGRFGRKRIPVA